MERILLRLSTATILIIGSILFISNTGGPTNTDATGSPFDSNQNSCRQCHTTFSLNAGTGSVEISAPATYYPGESYSVTVTVEQSTPVPAKYGFQALPLRDNNNAGGTITSGSGQGTWTSSGRSYVQHNSTTNTSGIFTFTWNAPSYADTIIFYSGGLAANGGNGNANDYVYTSTTTILPISPITFSEDSSAISCIGSCDGAASVTVSGGGIPPYSYLWSNGDTTTSITGQCAGTYSVTITDSEDHEEVAEMEIIEPEPILATFSILPSSCAFGDGQISVTATGGDSPYSYQWNDSANTTDSVILQAGIGWFTVTIADSAGCSIVDSAEIQTSTSGLTGFFQSENENCDQSDGVSILNMFSGNPPYTYNWNNGSTSNVASNLTAGTYTVTVTDDIGCFETFTTQIQEDFVLINVANTNITDVTCYNGQDGGINISVDDGDDPLTFFWSHDTLASNSQLSNLNARTYIITVQDASGCRDSASFNVSQPDSVYTETQIQASNVGFCDGSIEIDMFGGTPPYSYSWPHDNSISIANAIELCPGNYVVTASDAENCLFLVNSVVPELLTIEDLKGIHFSVYPNPAKNQIMVNTSQPSQLEILNIQGQIVLNTILNKEQLIDLSKFDSGTYTLVLQTKSSTSSKVIVIDR